MNEVSELQKRRAVNIIWNAAHSHDFQPDFKAYDEDGRAELYWNCIIGAVRRHYEYPKLEKLFASFSREEDGDDYEALLWLGLENCVFRREVQDRPVLQKLRLDYAGRFLKLFGGTKPESFRFADYYAWAHWMRVAGREPGLGKYDLALLDALEFPPELTTDEIVERAEGLFRRWFQIRAEEKKHEHRPFTLRLRRTQDPKGKKRYRRFGLGFADHPRNLYGGVDSADGEKLELRTTLSETELREFMEGKFGKAWFPPQESRELERELCRGNHENCRLHITGGEPAKEKIRNGFEALQKEREAAQIQRNRRWYELHLARSRASEAKLAAAIQNSVLLHLQPVEVKANSGRLDGGLVWRGLKLDDEKVFAREEQGNMGDLCVDILLDASTSQKDRQETVSNQGYIIASALTRCGVPCRVMSFCSMTGYTILRIFRDYNRPQDNKRIFEYVSNGCNRDGLAIRAAHALMNRSPCEHRLLIILSDVKPNDIVRIPGAGEEERIPYEREAGVRDTAFEVRRARADGISVVCVFTGDDEDLPAARLVYGRDFARIQSLDKLADAVSKLIQNQIRLL